MTNYKNNPAFTLVELLVVVIIIGILVASAAVSYQDVKKKQQYNAAVGMVNALAGVAKNYYIAQGSYVGTTSTQNTNTIYGTNIIDSYFHDYTIVPAGASFNVRVLSGSGADAATYIFHPNGTLSSCAGACV